MIDRIPGWSLKLSDAGLFLSPPDPRDGTLFYAERVRPLQDIHAILRDVERQFPSPRPRRILTIDPQITDEGEYAVIATLADRTQSIRSVGVVYGDDYYALCVGLPATAANENRFSELVRTCVMQDKHALGIRRRRFVYTPPPGWQGNLTHPFHAAWYPLDFPRNRSCLLIDPATPTRGVELDQWLVEMMTSAVDGEISDISTREITTPGGLFGRALRATVNQRVYEQCVFQDERYLYPLLLQSPLEKHDENVERLLTVTSSVQAIPRPRSQRVANELALSWLSY